MRLGKIGVGETIKSSVKKVQASKKGKSMKNILMGYFSNLWIKGNELNCSGYRIQAKLMQII